MGPPGAAAGAGRSRTAPGPPARAGHPPPLNGRERRHATRHDGGCGARPITRARDVRGERRRLEMKEYGYETEDEGRPIVLGQNPLANVDFEPVRTNRHFCYERIEHGEGEA